MITMDHGVQVVATNLQFFQGMAVLASDRPKRRVSGVFFHARSFNGDDDGLFELAAELTTTISENCVVINGGNGQGVVQGTQAWPGRGDYINRLRRLRCNPVVAEEGLHTRAEAIAFSKLAEEAGIKLAVVIGQPFHLPRIMLSHLRVMEERGYPMQIYTAAPVSVNYALVTSGNQGQKNIMRFEQIEAEFQRIQKYQTTHELATFPELFNYILEGRAKIAV